MATRKRVWLGTFGWLLAVVLFGGGVYSLVQATRAYFDDPLVASMERLKVDGDAAPLALADPAFTGLKNRCKTQGRYEAATEANQYRAQLVCVSDLGLQTTLLREEKEDGTVLPESSFEDAMIGCLDRARCFSEDETSTCETSDVKGCLSDTWNRLEDKEVECRSIEVDEPEYWEFSDPLPLAELMNAAVLRTQVAQLEDIACESDNTTLAVRVCELHRALAQTESWQAGNRCAGLVEPALDCSSPDPLRCGISEAVEGGTAPAAPAGSGAAGASGPAEAATPADEDSAPKPTPPITEPAGEETDPSPPPDAQPNGGP